MIPDMKEIRTFIAVPIESPIRSATKELLRQLQGEGDGIHWVPLENLHLTLKFLGDVDNTMVPEVCQVTRRCCAETPPTELQFAGLGAFPHRNKPRVIWAGIEQGGETFAGLVGRLEVELAKLGFKREPRDWIPHLTLGRARRGPRRPEELQARMERLEDFELGSMTARSVCVFASYLDKHGPSYHVMDTIPLGGES